MLERWKRSRDKGWGDEVSDGLRNPFENGFLKNLPKTFCWMITLEVFSVLGDLTFFVRIMDGKTISHYNLI
jgi:hypothetical protein